MMAAVTTPPKIAIAHCSTGVAAGGTALVGVFRGAMGSDQKTGGGGSDGGGEAENDHGLNHAGEGMVIGATEDEEHEQADAECDGVAGQGEVAERLQRLSGLFLTANPAL